MVRFIGRTQSVLDADLKVALMEAALTHARNVIEFLEVPKNRSKISPEDFQSGWSCPTSYKAQKTDINNWLSHLTWLRVEKDLPIPGKTWEVIPIVRNLFLAFADWAAMLPHDRQAWFVDAIAEAQAGSVDLSQQTWSITTTATSQPPTFFRIN